jgi:SpoIID/LytB domain protein
MLKKIIIVFCILLMNFSPVYCYDTQTTVRVGISDTTFSKFEFTNKEFYSEGELTITDKSSGKTFNAEEGRISVKMSNSLFNIFTGGILKVSNSKGPIEIKTTSEKTIEIEGLKRAGKQAKYRGEIQLIRNSKATAFSIVNVLDLRSYLKGVVPNEMPVSFGLEALKAQCIAARNYVIKAKERNAPTYDVYDSVASQVYFGANTERNLSNQAVIETDGLFSLYNGKLILALYSSTAGGYSESYENAFSDPTTGKFPGKNYPYLRATPDIEGMSSLREESRAREFYTTAPSTFDNDSPSFRWTREWTKEEFIKVLNTTMLEQKCNPAFTSKDTFSNLRELKIRERGESGKIMFIDIITENGTYTIAKELVIRRIFKKNGKALPSANFVCDTYKDSNGITKIKFTGGGFGHGVGLSQYGAGNMGKRGYNFVQILEHYYKNTIVGTYPIHITSDYNNNVSVQKFIAPNEYADIIFNDTVGIDNIEVVINGQKVNLNIGKIFTSKNEFNISKYIKEGENSIEVRLPADYNGSKALTYYIRIRGSKNADEKQKQYIFI